MLRDEWDFSYPVQALAEAAKKKEEHHLSRHAWWVAKRDEIMAEVREKGLEIQESVAAEYGSVSSIRGAHLVVKNDYQTKLNECQAKLNEHVRKINEYAAWAQMLGSHPDAVRKLDYEDWLFFFGH